MRRTSFAFVILAGLTLSGSAAEPTWPPSPALHAWETPFRFTTSGHILVRAKIDDRGPFNFIVDSGSPAVFISNDAKDQLGLAEPPDKYGRFSAESCEIEGGPAAAGVEVIANDLFQLEGMNGLGLAGVKLDGVIGYSLLSHYRLEFDFASNVLTWTKLDYEPVPFRSARGGKEPASLNWIGGVAKGLGKFMGRPILPPQVRGFVGIELADTDQGVQITRVLTQSPAAQAGLEVGDRLVSVGSHNTKTAFDALQMTLDTPVGGTLILGIVRSDEEQTVTITTGDGL